MKKIAGALLASLMLMPISPVYASDLTASDTTSDLTAATDDSTADETTTDTSADDQDKKLPELYQLNYADIQKVISERNPTIKANQDTLDSANNGYLSFTDSKGDVGSAIGSMTRKIKALRAQESTPGITDEQKAAIEVQIAAYQTQIASLGSTMESLENQEEDTEKSVAKAKVNVDMVNQKIYLGTQNLFFAKDALDIEQKGLEDSIAYLTKKSDALKLQKSLGLACDIDVSTLDQQIKDQNYQLNLAQQQQDTVRGQVNLMIGQEFNHPLDIVTNFSFDNTAAATTQDYSKDLATVMAKSYDLKLQKMEISAKKLSLTHSEETDGLDSYGYKSAQAALATEQTNLNDLTKKIKQQFDQAYNDVQDKLTEANLEESRLNDEKTKLNNALIANKVGTLSNLDLEGVQTEYDAQVLKAQNAQEDLMKANNVYQWLLKGVSADSSSSSDSSASS